MIGINIVKTRNIYFIFEHFGPEKQIPLDYINKHYLLQKY